MSDERKEMWWVNIAREGYTDHNGINLIAVYIHGPDHHCANTICVDWKGGCSRNYKTNDPETAIMMQMREHGHRDSDYKILGKVDAKRDAKLAKVYVQAKPLPVRSNI